jgi:hypothetical protein
MAFIEDLVARDLLRIDQERAVAEPSARQCGSSNGMS